jgi:hypothetical protein
MSNGPSDDVRHVTGLSAESTSQRKVATQPLAGNARCGLVVGCGIGAYFIGPQPRFPPNPARHGLPCDVTLPDHATFHDHQSSRYFGGEGTGSGETWTFTVTGTSLTQVADFYAQRLPGAGWRCVVADDSSGAGGWKDRRRVGIHASPPDITAFPDSADGVVLTIGIVTYGSGGDAPAC